MNWDRQTRLEGQTIDISVALMTILFGMVLVLLLLLLLLFAVVGVVAVS